MSPPFCQPFALGSIIASLACLALPDTAGAQTEAPKPKLALMAEIMIGAPDDEVVRSAVAKLKGFFEAGAADYGRENFANRVFLTPETMAALPAHARVYHDATAERMKAALMHLDFAKKVDFGTMFDNMKPDPIEGVPDAWEIRRMFLCNVQRPTGGYRLNFGNLFDKDVGSDPRFKSYTEIDAPPIHARLAARLANAPIHALADFRPPLEPHFRKEIAAVAGAKAALLGFAISRLGGRPVLDVYSGMGPGDGIVGSFMARRAGEARILGVLDRPPGGIVTADLGTAFARGMQTFAKAWRVPAEMGLVRETLIDFLDDWSGEFTLIVNGKPPRRDADDFDAQMEHFVKSLTGTLVIAVGDDAGPDVQESLEKLIVAPAVGAFGVSVAKVEFGDRRLYKVMDGLRHVAFGSTNRLVAISVGTDATSCLAMLDGRLAKRGKVPMPAKLGAVTGAVKVWLRRDLTRYVHEWSRATAHFLSSHDNNIMKWMQRTIAEDLFCEDAAVGLGWNTRIGTMLRVIF